jgi:hypothetical protein
MSLKKEPWSLYIVVAAVFLQVPSQPLADSFVLNSGKVIEGTVAGGSDISIFIKDKDGLLNSVMVPDIAEVRIDLESGEQIVGRLAGFGNDVYKVVADGRIVYIEDGRVVRTSIAHDDEAPAAVPNAGGPAIGLGTENPTSEPDSGDDYLSDILKHAPM